MTDMELLIFDGIKKTINRFRKSPFFYLSEMDILSSLQRDIVKTGARELYYTEEKNKIYVSLVHLEYPTNFKYMKEKLLEGYDNVMSITSIDSPHDHGDRGNFDLVVLNEKFIDSLFDRFSNSSNPKKYNLKAIMEHVTNKDVSLSIERKEHSKVSFREELTYAIEVKYISPSSARDMNMLEEVIEDNEKLRLAKEHSGLFLKPINLVFCCSDIKQKVVNKEPTIDKIKEYIKMGKTEHKGKTYEIPDGILNIFIEANLDQSEKSGVKPITWPTKDNDDVKDWQKELIGMVIK